jgi:serine/threonine protein kinase/roadblock/LC7 domain-containing protein
MGAAATQRSASIGPYRTMRQLGAGAMGEVFLAHDEDLGREIAIKLLPPHLAESAEHLFRLRHEARSASSLNHPNIVTIYEIGRDDDGRAFVAMEYVDGQTLREAMHGAALPVKKALQLAAQIADGLAAAHKRGLVHRDLKPENIMVTSDGVVKILDFGLAKSFELAASSQPHDFTEPGTIVGTPAYMSPEQARAGDVDYRSDQFSLGAILYEMLTGRHAFEGESGVETLFMIVRDEPAPLSVFAPHVPAPVRWIVDRCLTKDPEDRYVATRDLARDIQYIRDHFSEAGVLTPLREEKATLAQRARRLWPFAAMLAAALAIGAASTLWVKKPAPRAITSERYLTYSGQDFSPSVSPDGKLIAFSSNRDGKLRIWLKEVSGGSEVPLTAGPDDFPRFSPDGSSIVYTHGDADPDKPPVLYRVPVVGGEARRVIEGVAGDFSPDGRLLALTRSNVAADGAQSVSVLVAASDGSNPRELAKVDLNALVHPRWSPDGKRIAAVGSQGRVVGAVYVFDATSGATKILTAPAQAGEITSVVWTRDSRSVIYVRADSVEAVVGSSAHVIRHHVDSDRAEAIAWTSHNGTHLDVLADGRLILDARSPSDNLRETSIAGSAAGRWITRGNSSDRQPVYARDGKSILFTSNRSGNLDLWMVTADGGTVKRVTEDAAEDWDPAFTADGKRIVWSSGRSGNLEIWAANADGSDAKQISKDGQDAENPSATADGWVVYNSFHTSPEKMGVWKVREDGSRATRLVGGRTSLPEVSPDGRYVAYIADGRSLRQALRVARVSDGKDTGFAVPIRATHRTGAILGRMRWTPDGKAIAYLGQDENGVNGVFVQDFVPGVETTKTRRALGGFDRERATESFGISPDGKTLAIAGWEQLFSILSVDGVPGVGKEG